MGVETLTATIYPIEISGWNVDGEFFVERTELRWNEKGEKRVSIREAVRDGSVVFARLMLQSPTAPPFQSPTKRSWSRTSARVALSK